MPLRRATESGHVAVIYIIEASHTFIPSANHQWLAPVTMTEKVLNCASSDQPTDGPTDAKQPALWGVEVLGEQARDVDTRRAGPGHGLGMPMRRIQAD
ncbi:uncharacterized protein PSFLO_01692 [Pseudozyma flocculosa]|uniref:Uncharacterized protein n=1 Tax=Pseudozyma flocculosa TaxID=84751 RepID=A0A5C3EYX4_9BASI|nr:uncharacterized protein PSFLO_01692 [Pseudozyma flocculosa]